MIWWRENVFSVGFEVDHIFVELLGFGPTMDIMLQRYIFFLSIWLLYIQLEIN